VGHDSEIKNPYENQICWQGHYVLMRVKSLLTILVKVKNWHDYTCANYKPNSNLKQYLKEDEFLAQENYNLIEEHNLFEEL
jgi:hypothetical protein